MPESNFAELDQTEKLGQAFNLVIQQKYGFLQAPDPYVTPTGIGHLDALLGGGIVSSGPVLFSSTPESGKSTFAFQFSSVFQNTYKNGIIVYLDIETSGNVKSNQYTVSRIETFGLDKIRFRYEPIVLNVVQVFELVQDLVDIKKKFEEKTGKEFYILFVWDSIASTRCSKTDEAEDANKIIGFKAREVSFCLDKYTPLLKFNKISFIGIDQVRADMKIEGPYVQNEKTVGTFKNVKSATNIFSLQHTVVQWIFLSKKKDITYADGFGIDGWYLDIFTEKNKLAKSKHAVTCVFDKNNGIDKFWSEYYFLSELTPSETKIYKKSPGKLPYPLLITKSGAYVQLVVRDPNNPEVNYKSGSFYRKDAKQKYYEDNEFRQWFDYAVKLSVQYRIIEGILKQSVHLETPLNANIQQEIADTDQNIEQPVLQENIVVDDTEDPSCYQSVFT